MLFHFSILFFVKSSVTVSHISSFKFFLFQRLFKLTDDLSLSNGLFQQMPVIISNAGLVIIFYRFTGQICLITHLTHRLFSVGDFIYSDIQVKMKQTVGKFFLHTADLLNNLIFVKICFGNTGAK